MRLVLEPDDPGAVRFEDIVNLKLDLLRGIGTLASGVMLDPEYGIAPAIHSGTLAGSVGFIAALEQQGYLGDPTTHMTSLLPDWSVAKAKRSGASGIKLLVLYHPDAGAITEGQDALIESVVAATRKADIPLFLEPLPYAPPGSPPVDHVEFPHRRVAIESVRRLSSFGPDIMKVQFPIATRHEADPQVWREACLELTETCASPWALLSAGVDYATFNSQLIVATECGASGFMVGRAVWTEAAAVTDRARVIEEIVAPRFAELVQIATTTARPWTDVIASPPADVDWYRSY